MEISPRAACLLDGSASHAIDSGVRTRDSRLDSAR